MRKLIAIIAAFIVGGLTIGISTIPQAVHGYA